MKNHTENIAKYINDELSATDKLAFEKELASNIELKKEYDLQLQIIKGTKRLGVQKQVSTSFKNVKTKKLITKAVVGIAITIAAIGAVIMINKTINKPTNQVLYELNEQGTTNWSEADKQLEAQVFKINPLRDTIIETQNGIVFSVPANVFISKTGQALAEYIDLEIKEALTPLEIMKAGLSTTSNGKLLETGGMFYINARIGNENLSIDKNNPINANVPVNNNKKDMLLFKGERMADGSINWVDPKPLKKKLSTVDITKLNFYPEHFLDTLKSMGFDIKNKKLTDSIYYSFSQWNIDPIAFPSEPIIQSYGEESITKVKKSEASNSSDNTFEMKSGEYVFTQNCAVCHSMGSEKLTGPGLEGLSNRIPKGDWLKRYILNNEKVIKSGDTYANKIYNENGKAAMTVFEGQLNPQDIDALIDYITQKDEIFIDDEINSNNEVDTLLYSEINPAKIHAIWDKKFNRTILATKEFEERLKIIFKTCNGKIFNLYVNNLSKDLYEIDSVAATLCSGDEQKSFLEFYKRRDGGVDISSNQSKLLQKYFEEKRNTYAKAVNEVLLKMYKDEEKKLEYSNEKHEKQTLENIARSSKTFNEELDINMNEAYRQLGKERPKVIAAENYVSGDITQTGWNNVDRYVIESTVNRTTLDYTDPESGKKAIIKYEPITIAVNDYKNYDRVVCYMIPNKLSSFQLMKNAPNGFKETLNELMNYSIITIGFKGNDTYYNEISSAKAQAYTVDLKKIKTSELDKKLSVSFPLNQQADILKDIDYQLFDINETKRQAKINKREEIRNRLQETVFPCYWYPKTTEERNILNQKIQRIQDSVIKSINFQLNSFKKN